MLTKVVKSRAFKDRLKGHKDTIICLQSPYGPSGSVLTSASKDGQIRVWDLLQRQITIKLLLSRWPNETTVYDQGNQDDDIPQQIVQHHDNKNLIKDILTAITFTDKNVYGGYEDGFISSWNLKSGQTLYTYEGHEDQVTGLNFLNIRVLISSSLDGTIRLWDTTSGACETLIKFGAPINQMRFNEDTIQILYNKNTIAEMNGKTFELNQPIQFQNYSLTSFLVHQDNLILGSVDNNIYVYKKSDFNVVVGEIQNNQKLEVKPIMTILGNQGWALCMEILDKYLYVGTDERKIRVYCLKDFIQVEEFIGHEDGITQLVFAADGMLYSGSFDHSIRSWDLKEMHNRIRERAIMLREDLNSKRYEVYLKALPKKKKARSQKSKKKK